MKKDKAGKTQSAKKGNRNSKIMNFLYHEIALIVMAIIILNLLIWGIVYYNVSSSRVYIDKAEISSPIISLKPSSPGVLERVFVQEGDMVKINSIVAQVGDEDIKARVTGIVTYVQNTPGQFVTSQDTIVQMIDPNEFHVIGHLEEDKGLSDIKPGQRVVFTVDAFGSKEYSGVVDIISPTSRASDIVFSISDKREEQVFDVWAKFDANAYPELKNGMSARMWVYE